MKYVGYKDQKAFIKDLKRVYGAESEEIAMQNLEDMLMDILYDFYTEKESEKIYMQNIKIDLYTAIIKDTEVKRRINK